VLIFLSLTEEKSRLIIVTEVFYNLKNCRFFSLRRCNTKQKLTVLKHLSNSPENVHVSRAGLRIDLDQCLIYCEVLRLLDLERDLDFISRSSPPLAPEPLDLDLDLERLFSSLGWLGREVSRLFDLDLLRDFSSRLGLPSPLDPERLLLLVLFLLPDLDLDLPLSLLDLLLDLERLLLERLLEPPFFLLSSTILIRRPLSSVSSSLSIALRTSSCLANSTTPSFLRVL